MPQLAPLLSFLHAAAMLEEIREGKKRGSMNIL